MAEAAPTVFVVDDDDAVREAVRLLLRSVGLPVEAHASARSFLSAFDPGRPGCLLLDIRMPEMGGLELQEALAERGSLLPIIFLTGHGDVQVAVRALQAGALDFIEKPFGDEHLLERVNRALAMDGRNREGAARQAQVRERMERLSPREREVMQRVVAGQANKVIAIDLGLSERTVELHRAKVMEKMEADSLAHLVRMSLEAEGR